MPQRTDIMLKHKNNKFRNKVALILRTWRMAKSIPEVSKITKINENTVKTCLECSRFYLKSNYCLRYNDRKKLCEYGEIKDIINKRHSAYRKRIAICLKMWRKTRSTKETAKNLNITFRMAFYFLNQSKAYRKRYDYKKNCSRQDLRYIDRWSKKIKAIKLLGEKCEICGNNNIFNLDFHHKSKKHKTDKISTLITKEWKDIRLEVLKCRLLCRNCHREMHNLNQKNKSVKRKVLKIKHEAKCSRCGYNKNLAALEFHHITKNKKINLFKKCGSGNTNENNKPAREKLLKELDKCIVLCANCHNKLHNDEKRFKRLEKKIRIKVIQLI